MTAAIPSAYEPVIGLEVHVQLKTRTKMFCACPNLHGALPNSNTCPVCTGAPGALPVANREAFTFAIRAGLALEAEISRTTKFDRKNYFYPDLPKGYQISQYDVPITKNGRLRISSGKIIRITRAHLEEDAGKSFHVDGGDHSLVDLNRCGIPLLEIVSAPDLRSPAEAYDYLTELKLLLRHLEVSDCDMEKGSLRVDVNISVRPTGTQAFGTRSEIKNVNSFKNVERALEHEIARHIDVIGSGGRIDQETRLFEADRGVTRMMRKKEDSQDYRYFPDPDLPPHAISEAWIDEVRRSLPELPQARVARYQSSFGLSPYDSGVLVQDQPVAEYFEAVAALAGDAKAAANWITGDLFALMGARHHTIADTVIPPAAIASLIGLVKDSTLNVASARKVLEALYGQGGEPQAIARNLGLIQVSDRAAILQLVRQALAANPKAVEDLRAGKQRAAGAIVGHVMRESKGRANPALVNEILAELLR